MPAASLQLQRTTATATATTTATSTTAFSCHHHKQCQTIVNTLKVHLSCDNNNIINISLLPEYVLYYHTRTVGPNQCCSAVIKKINAPVSTVWSVVRRFDNPQAYKHFVKSCHLINGDGDVGTLREVHVVSGLPAKSSTERLEILDDERHVLSFSMIGGDHRLNNYRSMTTLHASPSGNGTVVVESFVVDIPAGNTKEDTCIFVDTILRCNLESLAQIAENMAKNRKII